MSQDALATRVEQLVDAPEYLRRILLAPVYEVAEVTPLDQMDKLSQRLGCNIWLKREDMQPVHSFKLRGAFNKLAQLTPEQRAKGVIAASAGNHAQGVALSARELGMKATIVMPRTTPDIKVNAVQQFGGNVILHGDSFDVAKEEAERLAREHGYAWIPPFDDADVIAGQGTLGMELLQQRRHIDYVFLPVGGGGLAAGVALYLRMINPSIKLIGVEANDSACLQAAWQAGEPVDLDHVGLFADGVAVKRIGDETFRVCRACLDDVITVSSDEICAAIQDIFNDVRAVAEPAGALSLAGLKKYLNQHEINGAEAVAVLSGANLNFHTLRYVSERTELGEGKEAVFAVTIPERPGSFRSFCEVLAGRGITEFNYRFADAEQASIYVGIRLKDAETERGLLMTLLEDNGYPVTDLTDNELAKLHIRYMVGGRPLQPLSERLFSVEFPEHPGALLRFLNNLAEGWDRNGDSWNITLFHYRNHGAAYGSALVGLEAAADSNGEIAAVLSGIGYEWTEETDNPVYQHFLSYLKKN